MSKPPLDPVRLAEVLELSEQAVALNRLLAAAIEATGVDLAKGSTFAGAIVFLDHTNAQLHALQRSIKGEPPPS